MTLIKAIIVDDELGNIETLHAMLEQFCKNVWVCDVAENNDKARELIFRHSPDLVFLDVQLQNETSFQLLKSLSKIDFEIIFVTAYNEFALRAIKFAAIDYLLKPVNLDELKKAVNRAIDNIERKQSLVKISHLLSNINTPQTELKKIGIVTITGITFKPINHIIRLKAEGNYTQFFFIDGAKEMSSKNLKEYEDILPKHNFCRIHNAHIINLNCIQAYKKGRGGTVVMEDGTEIEVSQRKKTEFLQRFNSV
jgi:two-component system LytT family response regulator